MVTLLVIATAHATAVDREEGGRAMSLFEMRVLIWALKAYQALHLIFVQGSHEGLLWCRGQCRRGDCVTVTRGWRCGAG